MGDGWQFNGLPEYAASYNGRDTGTYAWVDFSNSDSAVILEMEPVNMVNLTTPGLFFDYFSEVIEYSDIHRHPWQPRNPPLLVSAERRNVNSVYL